MSPSSDLAAARRLAAELAAALQAAPALAAVDPATRERLRGGLATIERALAADPPDPYAFALAGTTPAFRGGRRSGRAPSPVAGNGADGSVGAEPEPPSREPPARPPATQTLAARAGALADEIDFPAFVASLVHGTFDAVVDATIRQMEAYADLVSAVAKTVEDFTNDNVTLNQVRDHLVERHPGDLWLDTSGGAPRVRVRPQAVAADQDAEGETRSPGWLAGYGLDGQDLTDEFAEESLVPAARLSVGESRQQLLATMVLLGMSRINVKDGRISARVRFRAAARDRVDLDYAASQDPGGGGWGARGSATYENATTMISTVGVNAQADTDLKVELFGQVELNFVSETLPLDRFADSARMALLQRSARWQTGAEGGGAAGVPPVQPTPASAALPPAAPVPPGVPQSAPAAQPAVAPPVTVVAPAIPGPGSPP